MIDLVAQIKANLFGRIALATVRDAVEQAMMECPVEPSPYLAAILFWDEIERIADDLEINDATGD